jgi:ribosomal protein S15P/S13E
MYEYTEKIRYFINRPRKQHLLLKDIKYWNQLCSSLYVIEDSDLAINAYLNREFSQDDGEKYLRIYGLLQALFLQQNAVEHLCESLGIKSNSNSNEKLREIREIRNDSVGHPTKRWKCGSYHFISRITIKKSGFQLVSHNKNGETSFKDIIVQDLVNEQNKCLSKVLEKVINTLEKEEKDHKEKFKMERMEVIFKHLSFYMRNVAENIGEDKPKELGLMHIKKIKKEILDKLSNALKDRGLEIDTYDSIRDIYESLEYPVKELELFFDETKTEKGKRINQKTAYIFSFFIREKLNELRDIAKEIDEDYSN